MRKVQAVFNILKRTEFLMRQLTNAQMRLSNAETTCEEKRARVSAIIQTINNLYNMEDKKE